MGTDAKIVEFEERFAKDFADLNYEWIRQSYVVEPHDQELLNHPIEHIVDLGGQVFFALCGEDVAGTVALVNINDEEFELAKMAVSPGFQGQGISNLLMERCIDHARAKGKRRVIVESNTKQIAAIELYRKFGFKETPLDPNSLFVRVNIRMELAL
jgi:GNAT superfamily N-acetyltransferase